MKTYKNFIDSLPSRVGVFTIANFSPPTSEHQFAIQVVKKLAEQKKADHAIFVIDEASELPIDRKMYYLNQFFPNTNFVPTELPGKKIERFIESHRKLTYVDAQSSIKQKKLLEHANVEKFSLNNIHSDSAVKKIISKGLVEDFMSKLPTNARKIDGRKLMNDLRESMGLDIIKTSINLPKDNLREQYFNKQIFNVGDMVESAGQLLEITKRGTNYVICTNATGQTSTKWLHEIKAVEASKC